MPFISRRDFHVGGASLVALLLNNETVRASAISSLETVSVGTFSGKLARPQGTIKGGIVLIHEWWGLNEQMQSVAVALADEGYLTLAVDMFGKVATTREEAMANTKSVDAAQATSNLVEATNLLRQEGAKKVASMGFCFGGGWSFNLSVATAMDATIIYYGRVPTDESSVQNLSGPVLGHFGRLDKFINTEMVAGFTNALKSAGKAHEIHEYDADHAFANPTGNRYEEDAARLSYSRTLAFLEAHLGS
ncbi:MAG: dienelactone hydrolase family protein [Alphaproteobacteria bacterium]